MPLAERKARWRKLMDSVEREDVIWWRKRFVEALSLPNDMGGAMLRGWLAQGLAPDRLTVIDPALPELPAGVRSLNALPDDEAGPEVLVLAAMRPLGMSFDCASRS